MKLNLIYATSAYHCIGNDKGLIWDIPDELKYFYQKTSTGKSVLHLWTFKTPIFI